MIALELVTLNGVKYSEDVHEVMIPTPEGEVAIFDNHSPIVSLVDGGLIRIRKNQNQSDDQLELIAVGGGILEVTKNRVRVLVDEAENSEEISEDQAQEALKLAQKRVAEADDNLELAQALQQVQAERARLKLAGLKGLKKRR